MHLLLLPAVYGRLTHMSHGEVAGRLRTGRPLLWPRSYEDLRTQQTACEATPPPGVQVMSFDAPEEQSDITGSNSVTAAVATSCGEIALDLNSDEAPEHVNSFMFCARQGFYDGQVINRIRVNFGFVFGGLQVGTPRD